MDRKRRGEEKEEIKDAKLEIADKRGDKRGKEAKSKHRKSCSWNSNEGLHWIENQRGFI